jgi:hypothetical protein
MAITLPQYYLLVFRTALRDTWEKAGLKEAIIGALTFSIGLAIRYTREGAGAAGDDLRSFLAYGVGAVLIYAVGVFVWRLIDAPHALYLALERARSDAESTVATLKAKPAFSVTIHEYLYKDYVAAHVTPSTWSFIILTIVNHANHPINLGAALDLAPPYTDVAFELDDSVPSHMKPDDLNSMEQLVGPIHLEASGARKGYVAFVLHGLKDRDVAGSRKLTLKDLNSGFEVTTELT